MSITSPLAKKCSKNFTQINLKKRGKKDKQTEFGFRRQYSYTGALLYTVENIKLQTDKKIVASLFLDLSKTFDSFSHQTLYDKLKAKWFGGEPINLGSS